MGSGVIGGHVVDGKTGACGPGYRGVAHSGPLGCGGYRGVALSGPLGVDAGIATEGWPILGLGVCGGMTLLRRGGELAAGVIAL